MINCGGILHQPSMPHGAACSMPHGTTCFYGSLFCPVAPCVHLSSLHVNRWGCLPCQGGVLPALLGLRARRAPAKCNKMPSLVPMGSAGRAKNSGRQTDCCHGGCCPAGPFQEQPEQPPFLGKRLLMQCFLSTVTTGKVPGKQSRIPLKYL